MEIFKAMMELPPAWWVLVAIGAASIAAGYFTAKKRPELWR